MSDLVGQRVEWEKRGRGHGEIVRGTAVKFVPPGTSNGEALEDFLEDYREEWPQMRKSIWRNTYFRASRDTHTTERYFVIVEQEDTNRLNPVFHVFAPNARDVYPA